MSELIQTIRQLQRHPAYALTMILTLAIGVGLTTVVFAIYHGTMLATPGFTNRGDRLVFIEHRRADDDGGGNEHWGVSEAGFLRLRESVQALEGSALVQSRTLILSSPGLETERILGNWITAEGLGLLGIAPQLGRIFTQEDGRAGQWDVMVIGHDLWQRRYGGDPGVLGRVERVNGVEARIIGVMPKGFDFLRRSEAWMPFQHGGPDSGKHGYFGLEAFGLLATGVDLGTLNRELDAVIRALQSEFPEIYQRVGLKALPVQQYPIRGEARLSMHLMLGAMGLVLIITCANVANLLLVRLGERSRELATRLALGAPRGRLVSLLMIETSLLALAGGVSGLLLAWWALDAVESTLPSEMPQWVQLGMGGRAAAFALATTFLSALACGLLPALHATRDGPAGVLRDGGRGSTGGGRLARVRSALVITQVAFATVLLVGAGLFWRSYHRLTTRETGFETERILTFRVGLPTHQFPDPLRVRRFFEDLEAGLSSVPGVESAALATTLPGLLAGDVWMRVFVDGVETLRQDQEEGSLLGLLTPGVTPGYLDTLGIELVEGRNLTHQDMRSPAGSALVTRSFAEQFLGGASPLGRWINAPPGAGGKSGPGYQIVGVVEDVRLIPFIEASRHPPVAFLSVGQGGSSFLSGVLKVRGEEKQVAQGVRDLVAKIEPGIPIYSVLPLSEVLKQLMYGGRLFGLLFLCSGAIALLLAALGVYGVVAHTVQLRTREIGIRCALGASPFDILRWVGSLGCRLTLIGLGSGLLTAGALANLLRSQLFEINPWDPATYLAIALLLFMISAAACLLPIVRALRISTTLRLRSVD